MSCFLQSANYSKVIHICNPQKSSSMYCKKELLSAMWLQKHKSDLQPGLFVFPDQRAVFLCLWGNVDRIFTQVLSRWEPVSDTIPVWTSTQKWYWFAFSECECRLLLQLWAAGNTALYQRNWCLS